MLIIYESSARPCDVHGNYLDEFAAPAPGVPEPTFGPFKTRVNWDFAHYHFVEEQSSAPAVKKALNIWAASLVEHGLDASAVPWTTAEQLYADIDAITEGSARWLTYHFRYRGLLPENPPKWMTDTYELVTRDTFELAQTQLSDVQFKGRLNHTPYRQFQPDGQRVWSNLMSADWAWKQAVRYLPSFPTLISENIYRTRSVRCRRTKASCLSPLLQVATKLRSRLRQVTKSIIRCINPSVIW